MNIIGVDASVSKTGVVVLSAETGSYQGAIITSKLADPGRLLDISGGVVNAAVAGSGTCDVTLLVIEGLGQAIGNQRINYGLHWMIRGALAREFTDLLTLVVAPSSLKVFTVGRAGKGVGKSSAAAVVDRWPNAVEDLRDARSELPSEDVLEALGLVKVGECWANADDECWTERQRDVARLESFTAAAKRRKARVVYEDGKSVRQVIARRNAA